MRRIFELSRRLLGIRSRNEQPRFGYVVCINIDDIHNDENTYDVAKTVPDVKTVNEWGENQEIYR